MTLEILRIDGIERVQRATEPRRWWEAIRRLTPLAMHPVTQELPAAAPKRTGQLARAGFSVRVRAVAQGLIHGLEVDIGSPIPTAHLVEGGHRKIPRGPSGGTRRERRKALKERRAIGSQGFVPGRFFARSTAQRREAQTVALLEQLLRRDFER